MPTSDIKPSELSQRCRELLVLLRSFQIEGRERTWPDRINVECWLGRNAPKIKGKNTRFAVEKRLALAYDALERSFPQSYDPGRFICEPVPMWLVHAELHLVPAVLGWTLPHAPIQLSISTPAELQSSIAECLGLNLVERSRVLIREYVEYQRPDGVIVNSIPSSCGRTWGVFIRESKRAPNVYRTYTSRIDDLGWGLRLTQEGIRLSAALSRLRNEGTADASSERLEPKCSPVKPAYARALRAWIWYESGCKAPSNDYGVALNYIREYAPDAVSKGLPKDANTFARYVRGGRKAADAQVNTPRAGRAESARSIVRVAEI